ncbi:hypothetical protein CEXT_256401 [Caerostris extrusa]|uniref:Uncharacterized protein n=1 Tax=Caerostris extrusa TaxID=172846 RepID=A0AAV4STS4_CAEEX|nr:hypothetical protein CEXT_256401 [Caerostris extrusa]
MISLPFSRSNHKIHNIIRDFLIGFRDTQKFQVNFRRDIHFAIRKCEMRILILKRTEILLLHDFVFKGGASSSLDKPRLEQMLIGLA